VAINIEVADQFGKLIAKADYGAAHVFLTKEAQEVYSPVDALLQQLDRKYKFHFVLAQTSGVRKRRDLQLLIHFLTLQVR
jgi:hypothetical protein